MAIAHNDQLLAELETLTRNILVLRDPLPEYLTHHPSTDTGRFDQGSTRQEGAFLPSDFQIYVSNLHPRPLIEPYKDSRSVGAKRCQQAIGPSTVQMAVGMMRRAVRAGIRANYMAADAWSGNKEMMRAGLSLDITAIRRTKKNRLRYRVEIDGRTRRLDAKELNQSAVRKQWKKVRGMPWKAVEMTVDVDLATEKGKGKAPDYHSMKLFIVRGVNEEEDIDGGQKYWALFLSKDPAIGTSTMLETYMLRWGIDVYFNEAK